MVLIRPHLYPPIPRLQKWNGANIQTHRFCRMLPSGPRQFSTTLQERRSIGEW